MLCILQPTDEKVRWQKVLYTKIGGVERTNADQHHVLTKILSMAKVMHGLHMVTPPTPLSPPDRRM